VRRWRGLRLRRICFGDKQAELLHNGAARNTFPGTVAMPLKSSSHMHRHTRTKLLVVLVAALALSGLLLAGGASAQRAGRQGNDNASGGGTKRVVGVRSSETGQGSTTL
jgi:hypothetical protein